MERHELREISRRLSAIEEELITLKQGLYVANQQIRNVGLVQQEILSILGASAPQIKHFELRQLTGDKFMPIIGIQLGSTGTFQIGLVPPSGQPLQSGPTVSVDDSLVTLGAVDASLQFTATVDASDTAASFNVTVAGVNGAGTALSHVFNIPIIPAPPVQVTDFSLTQLS